jgi:uncharacterized protein
MDFQQRFRQVCRARYAPGRRITAYLIDVAVIYMVFVVAQLTVLAPLRELPGTGWMKHGLWVEAYTLLTVSLPAWLYFSLSESSSHQATPGKRLLGLKVTGVLGERISIWRALLRTIIKFLPWESTHLIVNLPTPLWIDPQTGLLNFGNDVSEWRVWLLSLVYILLAVYLLVLVWNRRRQSVHDLAARTVVTRTAGVYSIQPWIDPRLTVHASAIEGQGTFARLPIHAGEVVMVWGGTVFTEADVRAGKARPNSGSAIDEGLYLGDAADAPDSSDYYINHSCDPNLWMLDEITLAARRDIARGEELTADYALWETDPAWMLQPCLCGSTLCRHRITGSDWKLPELQACYHDHFIPIINRRIEKLRPRG